MRARVLLLMLVSACWHNYEPPPERPRMVGVHCADIALQGTPRGPGYDAFVEGRWAEAIAEIGTPTGRDVDAMRAYFRAGWSYWKLGDSYQSARALKIAFDLAERPVYNGPHRDVQQHEVLFCLIGLLATELTIVPEEIREFMTSIGGELYADGVLQHLAKVYVITGRTYAADRALALVRPRPPRKRR